MTLGKLPVVSGRRLIRWLGSLDYHIVRQRGSHIVLERRSHSGTHSITVPNHYEIAKGTLHDILGAVARNLNQNRQDLILSLKEFA